MTRKKPVKEEGLDLFARRVDSRLRLLEDKVGYLDGWRKDHNEWLSSLHADRRAVLNDVPTQGQYCVIGDKAKYGFGTTIGRKWHNTQEQAEQYALSLVRNNHSTIDELLVVKVVAKAGKERPDIQITRV